MIGFQREGIEFKGDHMRIEEDGKTTSWVFDDVGTGRRCGGCTLCCKLLPIPTLDKPGGKPCQHQRTGKGCAIYSKRPNDCRAWTCRWKADPSTAGLPRPDRCHYVIDCIDDYVTAIDNATGARRHVGAYQVWIDPAYRDAYKAPELRAWMIERTAKHSCVFVIRFSEREGFTLIPPAMAHDGQWHEVGSEYVERDHGMFGRDMTVAFDNGVEVKA